MTDIEMPFETDIVTSHRRITSTLMSVAGQIQTSAHPSARSALRPPTDIIRVGALLPISASSGNADGGNSAATSRISQHRHSISSMVTKTGHHAAVVGDYGSTLVKPPPTPRPPLLEKAPLKAAPFGPATAPD